MTTTLAAPAGTWQSRNGDSPALLAAVYTRAAQLISENGYTPYPEYEGETGYSLASAVEAAARAIRPDVTDAADLAEEALTRLAGVLVLTGQFTQRTGVSDLSDVPARWDADPIWTGSRRPRHHDASEAAAILATAAALLAALPAGGDR